jgi:CubicO group peptidase (beta-lactamase class C family)
MSGSRSFYVFAAALPILAGFARTSPDPDPKAIDAIFAQYDHTNTPGCALGVFRNGGVAYSRGYGMADLNHGIPITPSTVFYAASTSKQFTAFSVALAAEQGKLSLDDPIRKFVPELPAYADSITVRQLVGHVSGIRDYLGLWGISGRSFADEISKLPPPPRLDAAALRAFAGRYRSEELDTWATVEPRGDTLKARMRFGQWVTMEPIAPDVFTALGGRVAFERGKKGDVAGFKLSASRLQNVEFARVPTK